MVIFNSYVSLPEGIMHFYGLHSQDLQPRKNPATQVASNFDFAPSLREARFSGPPSTIPMEWLLVPAHLWSFMANLWMFEVILGIFRDGSFLAIV